MPYRVQGADQLALAPPASTARPGTAAADRLALAPPASTARPGAAAADRFALAPDCGCAFECCACLSGRNRALGLRPMLGLSSS